MLGISSSAEIDKAADWYYQAIQERDPFAVAFASAPYGQGLRESLRWPKLAKMMNLGDERETAAFGLNDSSTGLRQ